MSRKRRPINCPACWPQTTGAHSSEIHETTWLAGVAMVALALCPAPDLVRQRYPAMARILSMPNGWPTRRATRSHRQRCGVFLASMSTPFDKCGYMFTESYGPGKHYRLVLGFETLDDLHAAQDFVVELRRKNPAPNWCPTCTKPYAECRCNQPPVVCGVDCPACGKPMEQHTGEMKPGGVLWCP